MTALQLTTAATSFPMHQPMVLHVRVVSGTGGGPDKTILRSAQYAQQMGVRMAAVYLHPASDPGIDVLREQADELGCAFHAIPERGPIDPTAVRRLLALCQRLRVAVWHGHDYKSDALGLLLRRWWPMRLVTTVHGFTRETWRTRLYYHIDNWCLSRYDHVVAVSPPLYDHCLAHRVHRDHLSYVPNSIDAQSFTRTQDKGAVRYELGILQDRFVVGVVGRLSPEKGVDRAIRTIARLREKYPQVELHLIGDGPQRDMLQRLGRELNVDDIVRFWGWQTNTKRLYEMMDMLLLPSHTEGLPNAVLEAMALELPVAATAVGGVPHLLDKGKVGVLLSDSPEAWPREIEPLIVSEARGHALAQQARERVETTFSFDRRMARIGRIYQHLLRIAPRPLSRNRHEAA